MSTQQRIENRDDSGFVQAIAPDVARRQLKLSITLIATLTLATGLLATLGQLQPRHSDPAIVKLTVQAPGSLQVQQARTKSSVQPGG